MNETQTAAVHPLEEMGISREVVQAFDWMGFQNLTAIQQKCIPLMMDGHDIIAIAPTGTGKTLGFGIPMLEYVNLDDSNIQEVVLAPTRELAQQIADELIAAGGRAGVVFFDASREESFSGMVDEVAAKEGRLDILVNNFGSTDVKTDLDVVNGPSEDFFRIVNTNLKSVYLPSKAAVPLMAKNGGGSIINIGSVGGLYPDLSRTAYGVSKAAIHFLTKDIAVQYARQGVRCNAVLPGFTATDAALNNMSQAFLDLFLKNVPLNRPGRPEDIADAVAFLASDRAAFITGEILPVAGGFGLPTPLYGSYMSAGAKG